MGCTNTESVNSGGISKNHDLDDTHIRSINFAGGVSEGIPAESIEIRSEVHKTGFKTMALNIFSLLSHLDELRVFVSEERPHIICITDTKIDSTIDNSHIETDDYVVVRNDRNRHGGGVAIYMHKTVNYKLREDLAYSEIESISIQVKVGIYKPFIVTSVYRPSGKPVEYFNELDKLLNSIDAEDKETIYLGDTNCDMLDFTNNDTKNLMRLLTKFHLVELIKSPTRTTATPKPVIDHIITNRPASVSKSGVLSCGISDHGAVFMIKRTRLPKVKAPPKHLNVRNYIRGKAKRKIHARYLFLGGGTYQLPVLSVLYLQVRYQLVAAGKSRVIYVGPTRFPHPLSDNSTRGPTRCPYPLSDEYKRRVPHTTWYPEDMTKCWGSKREKGMVHTAGARQVFRKDGHPCNF